MKLFERLMAKAGSGKSSGGFVLSKKPTGEASIVFTDGLKPKVGAPEKEAAAPVSSRPEGAKMAASVDGIRGQAVAPQKEVASEPVQPERKKEDLPRRGDIFENAQGGRAIVQRVDEGDTVVYEKESARGIREKRGADFSYKPFKNFDVVVDMGGMQKIGRKKDPEYEERIERIIEIFNTKHKTIGNRLDQWSATLVEDADIALYEKLFERYEGISNRWNELGDDVEEKGEQRIQLSSELRLLEEDMFVHGIMKLGEENGNGDIQRERKGKQKSRLVKETEDKDGSGKSAAAFGAKITRERKRADATAAEGKSQPAAEVGSVGTRGQEIPATSESSEAQQGLRGNGENTNGLENLPWLWEGDKTSIENEIQSLTSEALQKFLDQYSVDDNGRRVFTFLSIKKFCDTEEYKGLSKKNQRLALEKWNEANYKIESLFLGKLFELRLEEAKELFRLQIETIDSYKQLKRIGYQPKGKDVSRGGKVYRGRVFIPDTVEGLVHNDVLQVKGVQEVFVQMIDRNRRATKEQKGEFDFEGNFKKQLQPWIGQVNYAINKIWEARAKELPVAEQFSSRADEQTSFELTVPKDQQREIVAQMQGFIMEGLKDIDDGLREAGEAGLDDYLRIVDLGTADPENEKQKEWMRLIDMLLEKGIGGNVVKIGQAYGAQIKTGAAERVATVIREKGTALLSNAMKERRLLSDKTK